uniref:AB hydrolase-1 domain-containing protein n=1 Tax=Varanus komodoensis TaxID=61221 RepID=A0A8D2IJS5_VARKO
MCYKMKVCLILRDSRSFKKWPVEYRWDEACSRSCTTAGGYANPTGARASGSGVLHTVKHGAGKLARYVLAHSVGRWLLYPGSVCLLNRVPLSLLVHARTRLMEDFCGKRAKLLARDGNEIDTMFVDRRKKRTPGRRGKTLVICCEGNGSFYEVGCFVTPLKAGYSVLGWNHPGFARSTGKPYPQNDCNAMEVVVQYAVHRLKFSLPEIAIYGYSLGSYTASWAGMAYPKLGALVLDASFDSLLPLAAKVIGKTWRTLVKQTVAEYFNLNVVDMLCQYPGPALLIRRTLDEVTSTEFSPETHLPRIGTNRANELLMQLLRSRYPNIISGNEDVVRHWLAADCPPLETLIYSHLYKVDDTWCLNKLKYFKSSLGPNTDFPWKVGKKLSATRKKQLALFLAKKHLKNVETTHGRTLPPEEFEMPWKL